MDENIVVSSKQSSTKSDDCDEKTVAPKRKLDTFIDDTEKNMGNADVHSPDKGHKSREISYEGSLGFKVPNSSHIRKEDQTNKEETLTTAANLEFKLKTSENFQKHPKQI